MLHLKSEGHRVISLSQREGVEINPYLRSHDIEAHSYLVKRGGRFVFFVRHLLFFIRFCRNNNIDYVFSHLDPANFISSIGQYFVRSKVFLNRHHIDEAALYNFHSSITYRITNLLAKRIIVVSNAAIKYMVEVEGVARKKLYHVNLAYDFSLFKMPDTNVVSKIKDEFGGGLILLTACRLTKYKRPEISVEVLEKLRLIDIPAKLLILGSGEMQDQLKIQISKSGLVGKVFLLGHVNNILDYMEAADFIIHPSVLESSCVVVKEAGLIKKPVVVCRSVGDFDDYIVNGLNGFLIDPEKFVNQAVDVILKNHKNKQLLNEMGDRLNADVRRLFDVKNVSSQLKLILKD